MMCFFSKKRIIMRWKMVCVLEKNAYICISKRNILSMEKF